MIAALSIGYLGARFGIYGLIHGGVRYSAGYGGSLGDNNTMALALAMGVPLGWYAKDLIGNVFVRLSLIVSVFLTIGAIVFTHSRGGALSLAAAFLVIILHSRRRLILIAVLAILTGPSVYLVKDSYFDRMSTLNGVADRGKRRVRYGSHGNRTGGETDVGGLPHDRGRIRERQPARPLVPVCRIPRLRADVPLVIHNTYLQMLVDSGTFALLAYLMLLFGTIVLLERSTLRLRRLGSPLQLCPLGIEDGAGRVCRGQHLPLARLRSISLIFF